jgi:hypothetical protein
VLVLAGAPLIKNADVVTDLDEGTVGRASEVDNLVEVPVLRARSVSDE